MGRIGLGILLALFTCRYEPAGAPRVTACEIVRNPSAYNHKLIEVTGLISHGFEDFTLFDPGCPSSEVSIWVEYGGRRNSGTIYCCGPSTATTRDEPLVVENVPTSLLEDEKFTAFDRLIQRNAEVLLRATLVGHYFSGERQELPGGTAWVGYGHFGLSSLFVIERVLRVEEISPRKRSVRDSRPPNSK